MPMGLKISPSIWQSYINAILNCLQSKKYCEAIMDDFPYHKIRGLIKGTTKEWFENIPKEMPVNHDKFTLHGK